LSVSTRSVDLNADVGEGFPWDEDLLDRVTSANICCGAHAGDLEISRVTIESALRKGVAVGAHPGYPDREHFGRRRLVYPPEMYRFLIVSQVVRLGEVATQAGGTLRYLKSHGALYNQAQEDPQVGWYTLKAAIELQLPILGLPGGRVEEFARACSHPFVAEGFADRRYTKDGRLVPRSESDAMIEDSEEMAAQIRRLIDAGVQTICLHGDAPGCVERADRLCSVLAKEGIEIRSMFDQSGNGA
jgi:5-oxoprolinase (ATP-hydrolysing) subunit A